MVLKWGKFMKVEIRAINGPKKNVFFKGPKKLENLKLEDYNSTFKNRITSNFFLISNKHLIEGYKYCTFNQIHWSNCSQRL